VPARAVARPKPTLSTIAMRREEPAFKIKNGTVPVFVIHITTLDMERLKSELEKRSAQMPGFFANTPVVLGLAGIAGSDLVPDFADLTHFLVAHGMRVAGVQGGSEAQRLAAAMAGLGLFPEAPARKAGQTRAAPSPEAEKAGDTATGAPPEPCAGDEQAPMQPELPGLEGGSAPGTPPADAPAEAPTAVEPAAAQPLQRPTLVIDKPVRAGQRIHAEGANLVVLAIVNAGAELIADGDIHVYAPLRGRALAGARGNEGGRIFVQSMEAELVSVAGYFQVFEEGLPDTIRGKAVQVYLRDGQLRLEPLRP
jgi:septum site-determining protein MinC